MATLYLMLATTIHLTTLRLSGILALVLGVLILVFPKALNYLVALYLIVIGAVSVFSLHIKL